MLRKSQLTTSSAVKLSGLALGLCLTSVATGVAFADVTPDTSVTTPSSTTVKAHGIKTAIVASTDTGGDINIALRALKAAHVALGEQAGFIVLPADAVAKSLKDSGYRWPFSPNQFPDVRKKISSRSTKKYTADRAVSVTVSPVDGKEATRKAVIEMYDFSNGGLVGYGEAIYTATSDSLPLVNDGKTGDTDLQSLAVDGAILRAVADLNKPAELKGIIVSLPNGHITRLSKGLRSGLRNGTRIEYVVNDHVVARGSVIDAGFSEAIATVAPESAYPMLAVNGDFRTVNIPNLGTAGKSVAEKDAKEWKRFELEFGLGVGVAGLGYLLFAD